MKRLLISFGWLLLWIAGPILFLWSAAKLGWSGFPLDDAWIHQTYARSLAGGMGWSYAGGPPSAGSTSPLWTIMLVPAYWLSVSPVAWSTVINLCLLLATGILSFRWVHAIYPPAAPIAFFLVLTEWHLVWGGLSGMETLLFCCWIAAVVYGYFGIWTKQKITPPHLWLLFGGFIGLGVWIWPEGILLALAVVSVLAVEGNMSRWKQIFWVMAGAFVVILFYLLFQMLLHGLPLPNTFYAKPAEYAALTTTDLVLRFLQAWVPLLAGSLVLGLLFLVSGLFLIPKKEWLWNWPIAWAILHVLAFAVILPATYQHGRYLIPVLPILLGFSAIGYARLADRFSEFFLPRLLVRSGIAALAAVAFIFLWLGAGQYARDVDFIQTQLVQSSEWVKNQTPVDSVIAAHDIGALGFFSHRTIVDLGGLVDLDALDLLGGKSSLPEYLVEKHADYLVTFPSFYPAVLTGCQPTQAFLSAAQPLPAEDRMAIFDLQTICGTTGPGEGKSCGLCLP